jgi:hypothetical protein
MGTNEEYKKWKAKSERIWKKLSHWQDCGLRLRLTRGNRFRLEVKVYQLIPADNL